MVASPPGSVLVGVNPFGCCSACWINPFSCISSFGSCPGSIELPAAMAAWAAPAVLDGAAYCWANPCCSPVGGSGSTTGDVDCSPFGCCRVCADESWFVMGPEDCDCNAWFESVPID